MATLPQPAGPHGRLFDDSFLRFLPAPVREPRRAWLAVPIAWALSLLGSVLLAAVVQKFAPALKGPEIGPLSPAMIIFAFVIFAPVVESIIMGGVITLFLRWMSPTAAIVSSALAWALFHSLQAPAWGFAIWWPFLIFSTLFMVWRQRGFWAGVGVATATHMLQNLGPALTLIYHQS